MNASPAPAPRAWTSGLARYSSSEVGLVNWFAHTMPGAAWWTERVSEALGSFFEKPAGVEVTLRRRNSADSAEPEKTFTFKQAEIVFGREENADVPVPIRSVGKQHARIRVENGVCLIEDLGTPIGTYLNRMRLTQNVPRLLSTGDEIAVFPYTFEVRTTAAWEPDADFEITPGSVSPCSSEEFARAGPWDAALLPIAVQASTETAWIEAGGPFIDALFRRITEPLGAARSHLGASAFDSGMAELLVASVFENANRALGFPLEIEAGALRGSRLGGGTTRRGLAICVSMRAGATRGNVRVWLPFPLIAALRDHGCAAQFVEDTPAVWRFPVSRGYVCLTADEIAGIERNDVVLIQAEPALLMPCNYSSGWLLTLEGDNFVRASLDNFFEREPLANEETMSAESPAVRTKPDFGAFPVHLHVILGEKDLTLAEANNLSAGSVLDLDLPAGPVRLAVNGRIVGDGELVEIEGRLGVRIAGWRGA